MIFEIYNPNNGDTKTEIKYCLLPLVFGCEVFWLEKVRITYTYVITIEYGNYWRISEVVVAP